MSIETEIAQLTGQPTEAPTPEQITAGVERLRKEEKFDAPLTAAALGAARGATLGLSDVAGRALGFQEEIAALQEFNPTASTVGEVGGTIGSAVTGIGGAGLATKLGAAAAKKIGTKSLAKQILGGAAAAATEGAIIGAGQTVSEAALRDYTPEQVAESLIANVGTGALLGGALGGAASGIKGKFFSPKIQQVLPETPIGAVDDVIAQTDDIARRPTDYAGRSVLGQSIPNADDMAQASRELGIDVANTETLIGKIQNFAAKNLEESDSFIADQVKKNKKEVLLGIVDDLDRTLKVQTDQTAEEIGARIKKEITEEINKKRSNFNVLYESRNLDLAKIKPAKKQLGQALSGLKQIKSVSGVGASKLKQATNLLKSGALKNLDEIEVYRSEIASEAFAQSRLLNYKAADQLNEIADVLTRLRDRTILRRGAEATGGNSKLAQEFINQNRDLSKNWRAFRQDLSSISEMVGKKPKSPNQFIQMISELPDEQVGQKFLQRNLKNANQLISLKTRFPNSFETLRQRYVLDLWESSIDEGDLNLLKFLEKTNKLTLTAKEILFTPEGARTLKNLEVLRRGDRSILRTPNQEARTMGGMLGSIGDLVGGVVNNVKDLGIVVLTKALGAVDETATKGVSPTKNALLSDPTIGNAVKKTTNKIYKGVKKFIREGAIPGTVKGVIGTPEENKKKVDEYALYRDDPETLVSKIVQNTGGLEAYSPDTALAVTNSIIEGAQFLSSKIPPRDPVEEDIPFSDYEAAVFNRYARAVEKPITIIDDIESGTLTREAIEAVSTVYPELMTQIREAANEEMSKFKGAMSFDKKIQLSMLLGFPMSATMKPDFIAKMQSNPSQDEAAPQKTPIKSFANNFETDIQRVTKG